MHNFAKVNRISLTLIFRRFVRHRILQHRKHPNRELLRLHLRLHHNLLQQRCRHLRQQRSRHKQLCQCQCCRRVNHLRLCRQQRWQLRERQPSSFRQCTPWRPVPLLRPAAYPRFHSLTRLTGKNEYFLMPLNNA